MWKDELLLVLMIGRQPNLAGRRGLNLRSWDYHLICVDFREIVGCGVHASG